MAEQGPILILVAGPTAAGKTEVAARLARRFHGEIIGADSIQVYRGLDAASAKPSAALRREIPHHLIDVQDPAVDFSAGDYARLAGRAIEGIRRRGRLPIVAGGTGLYVRALLRGLAGLPRRQPRLRRALARYEERRGEGSLHEMLRVLDPPTAERLPPRDRQRIVRALEVALASGRPLSRQIDERPFGEEGYRSVKVGITAPWDILTQRIEERVESFFAQGLLEEVEGLLGSGVPASANCFKALGYREALRHRAGDAGYEETVALVKANTRRYAKRQFTWFRREPGIRWFELGEDPGGTLAGIEAYVEERLRAEESRDGERNAAG